MAIYRPQRLSLYLFPVDYFLLFVDQLLEQKDKICQVHNRKSSKTALVCVRLCQIQILQIVAYRGPISSKVSLITVMHAMLSSSVLASTIIQS